VGATGQDITMMGIAADMIAMTIIETEEITEIEGIMKEDKTSAFQGSDVVSKLFLSGNQP